jgi:hypothetical protein
MLQLQNGRLFDPMLGMFMQPNPSVDDPGHLQSYNRYSYCENNPLTCTDPTGLQGVRPLASSSAISLVMRQGAMVQVAVHIYSASTSLAFAGGARPLTVQMCGDVSCVSKMLTPRIQYTDAEIANISAMYAAQAQAQFMAEWASRQQAQDWYRNYQEQQDISANQAAAQFDQAQALAAEAAAAKEKKRRQEQQAQEELDKLRKSLNSPGFCMEAEHECSVATGETAAWKVHESVSAKALEDAGYTIVKQVRVTWAGAEGAYAVIDTVGTKEVGDVLNIVLSEAKDGLTAKLSSAQKALFETAFKSGNLIIENAKVAGYLGIEAGTSLASQGNLYVAVDASVAGARASVQFSRIAQRAAQGGFVNFGVFFSDLKSLISFGVGTVWWSLLTYIPETGGCKNGVCGDMVSQPQKSHGR